MPFVNWQTSFVEGKTSPHNLHPPRNFETEIPPDLRKLVKSLVAAVGLEPRPTDYENTGGTCGVVKVLYFIRFFNPLQG
jgi:hypothetical protein